MYYQPLKYYKPRENFRGAALAVNYRDDVKAVFMQVARQTQEKDANGNFTFDWNGESITMKLGESDIASIHSLLEGKIGECKLFHQTDEFNSALSIEKTEYKDKTYFAFRFSKQDKDKHLRKISIGVSEAEAWLLDCFFRAAVERMFFEPIQEENSTVSQGATISG